MNNDGPEVVKRSSRTTNVILFLFVIFLFCVLFYYPKVTELLSAKTGSINAGDKPAAVNKEPSATDTSRSAGMRNLLDKALEYDRKGDRVEAEKLFRQLMRQAANYTVYTPDMAILFPRAAEFFSKGKEIPAKEVENLYLDAIDAIKLFYPDSYYDYENMYRGLEKHYESLGRHKEAAMQASRLFEFYKLHRGDDKDAQLALMLPTAIRIGNHLMAVGQPEDARIAYHEALEMTKASGQSTKQIEELIEKTFQQEGARD